MSDYWVKGKGVDEPIEMNLLKNLEEYEIIWRMMRAEDKALEREKIDKERIKRNLNYEVI